MNCKRCGAPMEVVAGQMYFHCEYCDTYDFPDPDRDGIVLLNETTVLPCPACSSFLVTASINDVHIHSCPNCRGNLVSQVAMLPILRLVEPRNWKMEDSLQTPDRSEFARKLTCPSCRKIMEDYPYGGAGNIIIQGCSKCELIWLDYGELARIIRSFIQMYDRPSYEEGAKRKTIQF